MAEKTVYIAGAGAFTPRGFHPGPSDAVAAADGGYESLRRHGILPGIVLGDMDSVRSLPDGIARLRFPRSKDLTDMALAIRLFKARGYRRFKLYGALGGRLDHSLANFYLLAGLAGRGMRGMIVAPELTALSVSNGALALPPLAHGTIVSVFAWGGEAMGVTLEGLRYPLKDATLNAFEPLGVSNEALGGPVKLLVRQGTLIVAVLNGRAQA